MLFWNIHVISYLEVVAELVQLTRIRCQGGLTKVRAIDKSSETVLDLDNRRNILYFLNIRGKIVVTQISKPELVFQSLLSALVGSRQDVINVADHVDQVGTTVLGKAVLDGNKVLPLLELASTSPRIENTRVDIRSSRLLRQAHSRRGRPRKCLAELPPSNQPEHRCRNRQSESKAILVSYTHSLQERGLCTALSGELLVELSKGSLTFFAKLTVSASAFLKVRCCIVLGVNLSTGEDSP